MSVAGLTHGIISWVVRFVPSKRTAVDTPIGRSSPSTIIPTNAATFVTASQYSISPYRRTLKILNTNGKTHANVIQSAGLICDLGIQYVIVLAMATSLAGNPVRYLRVKDAVALS